MPVTTPCDCPLETARRPYPYQCGARRWYREPEAAPEDLRCPCPCHEETETMMTFHEVTEECQFALATLANLFADDVRLTLIMRRPGDPECEFVLTDEETSDVLHAVIERRWPCAEDTRP